MVPVIRSWWQKIKTHPTITVLIMISLLVFLLIGGYKLNWSWTGFNGADKTDKTLYDWLQLLIIPAIIAFVGLWYSQVQKNTEQKIAAQRYEQEQNLALDKQREDLLQVYLDRMSELLLDKQLRTSEPDAEVRNVARVRTINILFQLDARRIGYVFEFLRESGLMSNKTDSLVSFSKADLRHINFSGAWLQEINLSGAWLDEANLSEAYLFKANFHKADLSGANLSTTVALVT